MRLWPAPVRHSSYSWESAHFPEIVTALIANGLDPATPCALVADATLASQRVVRSTLADVVDDTKAADIGAPAVTVIGAVAGLEP